MLNKDYCYLNFNFGKVRQFRIEAESYIMSNNKSRINYYKAIMLCHVVLIENQMVFSNIFGLWLYTCSTDGDTPRYLLKLAYFTYN